jgi:hypothetical protein
MAPMAPRKIDYFYLPLTGCFLWIFCGPDDPRRRLFNPY